MLSSEPVTISKAGLTFIFTFLSGLIIGHFGWNENEKEFLEREEEINFKIWADEWRSMDNRRIDDVTRINKAGLMNDQFGPILSATLSLIPEKHVEKMYFHDETCPLCLQSTTDTNRLPTYIAPVYERIADLAACVWVHDECFNKLPNSDEAPKIPW